MNCITKQILVSNIKMLSHLQKEKGEKVKLKFCCFTNIKQLSLHVEMFFPLQPKALLSLQRGAFALITQAEPFALLDCGVLLQLPH